MQHFNIMTRRGFLGRNVKLGAGLALSSLVDLPFVVRRALAEQGIGLNGKKVLFVFLRGANDALNAVIPAGDDGMYDLPGGLSSIRPDIGIPLDTTRDYALSVLDHPVSGPTDPTYHYEYAIRAGNGFAALHPSLKFLCPMLGAGELALIHRVGYPNQSRSHFDSQRYYENGDPNNNANQEGIFYRAMVESGLAGKAPLTGVSVQSALPLLLRGSRAAMTNLSDPGRYNLLGVPYPTGEVKADQALAVANRFPFPEKLSRELLSLQYQNLSNTLDIFGSIDFNEEIDVLEDDEDTDGHQPYRLFPTSDATNGGGSADKFVVDSANKSYDFFQNLRAAAIVLNKTDAIVAGTELTGWDTHSNQGGATGTQANLLRRVGWAMYALRKYFKIYGKGGSHPTAASAKAAWDDMIVVTLSEFGRTTVENGNNGTDHAEAGCMLVGGGKINGGIHGCHPSDAVPWITGPANQGGGVTGSMFGVNNRYLKRAVDYRSVLGEIIRDHLGASPEQLGRIIPGYADPGERLQSGGTSSIDDASIMGEVGLV